MFFKKVRMILLLLLMMAIAVSSLAEIDPYEVYVICQPGDYVNVRLNPSRKSEAVGYADSGDYVLTDGKTKNGFLRVYGIGEMGVGWIHNGYVVEDEPQRVNCTGIVTSKGKLAARKYIKGKVRKWLHNMDKIKVYWITDDWCVTSEGFVKTEFLDFEW